MENLAHIELSELYDLLVQKTNQYMKMLSEGFSQHEFDQCRENIISIQREIQLRRQHRAQFRDSGSDNSFNSGYLGATG